MLCKYLNKKSIAFTYLQNLHIFSNQIEVSKWPVSQKQVITEEMWHYFKPNKKGEKISLSKSGSCSYTVLRKVITLNNRIGKEEMLKNNDLYFDLKKAKEGNVNPKLVVWKE